MAGALVGSQPGLPVGKPTGQGAINHSNAAWMASEVAVPVALNALTAIHDAAGCDANIVGQRAGTIAAKNAAHRVCAVTVVIVGCGFCFQSGIEPMVVVVKATVALVAGVLLHQGRVIELRARIEIGHQDAFTGDTVFVPDPISTDFGDIPFGGLGNKLIEDQGLKNDTAS